MVDLLIKLYKFPNFSISRALLHGTGAAPPSAAAAAREGPDVPIAGRCPGALADALLRLAEGVRLARLTLTKDLRTRLLTLFAGERGWAALQFTARAVSNSAPPSGVHTLLSTAGAPLQGQPLPAANPFLAPCPLCVPHADFALILPNDSYIKDLGALLPAVGAVAEAVGAASSARMSGGRRAAGGAACRGGCSAMPAPARDVVLIMHAARTLPGGPLPAWLLTCTIPALRLLCCAASLSGADMSLDALNTAQEENLLVLRLFRWAGRVWISWPAR